MRDNLGNKKKRGMDMIIKKYYTEMSFKQAVELYKREEHLFLGLTWNCACFKDMILVREYDNK